MTKIEKIAVLLDGVEQDVRKSTIRDIVSDLKDFLKDAPANERDGMKAAIEIIESNYLV